MKNFFAYIRVSTAKQGEHGVSLPQQREAIERYAKAQNVSVVRWFEERATAAKRGRSRFDEMLSLLRSGKAGGVVIHKIDRSARNLKDWSDLGELIDSGVDVRFVSESLDLQSRGGRLSADIQAVVAADFIRNLREETRKGIYGRIKQGLYPMPAPIGYLDSGSGKPKIPDPVAAPLIRRLYELYASGDYSLTALVELMYGFGLRTKSGKKLVESALSYILANPFYIGLIRIKRTGETFPGAHEPVVPTSLFEQVRRVASGKCNKKLRSHDFTFRRLLRCDYCGRTLYGEVQKGHVYYRCQTSDCPTKTVRQDSLNAVVLETFKPLIFSQEEQAYLKIAVQEMKHEWTQQHEDLSATAHRKNVEISDRLNRLTDAYLDGVLDKELFDERKKTLLMERQSLKEMTSAQTESMDVPKALDKFLELAGSAYLQYKTGIPDERRELLQIVISNRIVRDKTPVFTLDMPFQQIAERCKSKHGGPSQNTSRTCKELVKQLASVLANKLLEQDPHWTKLFQPEFI